MGAEMTDCDSPISLVNATFQWINDNLKDDIDFVIWTGDSARHDNDERYPRNEKQVVGQNELLVSKFVEVFGKDDNTDDPDPTNDFTIPIIPTFGNNDILPHNILEAGPNKWTRKYSSVWDRFVPEEQRHTFVRGGWFFVEVIHNELVVFSLNTIYFFDSNTAVDGCDKKSEPGYEHMNWLRVQLELLRQRGMKAIITGHVPPSRTESKQSWDETCWQKYTLWLRQYRDVVIGSVYGHANIDHFMIQDARELKYKFLTEEEAEDGSSRRSNDMFHIESKSTYLNEMRTEWSKLPAPPAGLSYTDLDSEDPSYGSSRKSKKQKKREKFLKKIGGEWAERYSLSLVSPSVVPNYYPTLRVIEYNITGLEDYQSGMYSSTPAIISEAEEIFELDAEVDVWDDESAFPDNDHGNVIHDLKKKKEKKRKNNGKKRKPKAPFVVPKPPSKSSPPGPAYSPQTLTWLSYTQYFANLTHINNEHSKNLFSSEESQYYDGTKAKLHMPHLKPFKYEVEYDTKNDNVYKMDDLTMRNYLDLAERMGRKELKMSETDEVEMDSGKMKAKKSKNKLWHNFVKRAFVLTKLDEELEDHFG